MSATEIGNSPIHEKKKIQLMGYLFVCKASETNHYNTHSVDEVRHHRSMPEKPEPIAALSQLLVVGRPWLVPEL